MDMTTSSSIPGDALTFRAVIQQSGKTATGIPVPAAVVERLGAGKRPAVQVTLQGYTYRSTVAPLGGAFMLPLSAEHRAAAGVVAGDEVEVTLARDTAPRVVSMPPDLAAALAADAEAQRVFAGLSYSNQQRVVLPIEEAKTPETRQRRIAAALGRLRAGHP
jgi:hypothetical protein